MTAPLTASMPAAADALPLLPEIVLVAGAFALLILDLFIDKIEELKAKVGIKKSIAEYGISEETFMSTLDQMVEDAFDDQCTGANPRYPLLKEIKAMYLKAYYGEKA